MVHIENIRFVDPNPYLENGRIRIQICILKRSPIQIRSELPLKSNFYFVIRFTKIIIVLMIFLLYRLLCRNKTLGKIHFESVCFRGSELNPTPEAIIIYLLYFFNDFYVEMKILRNSEVCSGSRLFSRSNIRIRIQFFLECRIRI